MSEGYNHQNTPSQDNNKNIPKNNKANIGKTSYPGIIFNNGYNLDASSYNTSCLPKSGRNCLQSKLKSESYATLIEKAINSSPIKMMTLSEIYDWFALNGSRYGLNCDSDSKNWRNSIRHNLSLQKKFQRIVLTDSDKKAYWKVVNISQNNPDQIFEKYIKTRPDMLRILLCGYMNMIGTISETLFGSCRKEFDNLLPLLSHYSKKNQNNSQKYDNIGSERCTSTSDMFINHRKNSQKYSLETLLENSNSWYTSNHNDVNCLTKNNSQSSANSPHSSKHDRCTNTSGGDSQMPYEAPDSCMSESNEVFTNRFHQPSTIFSCSQMHDPYGLTECECMNVNSTVQQNSIQVNARSNSTESTSSGGSSQFNYYGCFSGNNIVTPNYNADFVPISQDIYNYENFPPNNSFLLSINGNIPACSIMDRPPHWMKNSLPLFNNENEFQYLLANQNALAYHALLPSQSMQMATRDHVNNYQADSFIPTVRTHEATTLSKADIAKSNIRKRKIDIVDDGNMLNSTSLQAKASNFIN